MKDPRARPSTHSIAIEARVDTRADKVADVVARQLARDVIARNLGVGDALDSEQAMRDRLQVSRESLREALRLLEVAGLIDIRRGPGGGAFVGTVDPSHLGRFESLYFQMAGATYAELFEAYADADARLAERAARHPDSELRRSEMARFRSGAGADADLEAYIEHHAGFHAAIAGLARNRVMQITLHSIGLLVARHYVALVDQQHLTLADARSRRPFVEEDHRQIADAIVAGNHRRARTLMFEHVQHIVSVLVDDGLNPADVIEWV
jgi:DNA-binding FadR family transcriptional regulator